MQLIKKENDFYVLKILSYDDLFILSQILSKEDKCQKIIQRKVKIDGVREKQITKTFNLEIEIKKIEFIEEKLKINGEILNENEFVAKKSNQSFIYEINDIIEFEKKNFLKFEEKLFEKGLNSKQSLNFCIIFDKDNILAFEFSEFNFTFLFEKNNLGSKKNYYEINEEEEKYNLIKEYLNKNYENFIFASTFNFNKKLKKFCQSKIKNIKIFEIEFCDISRKRIINLIEKINSKNLIDNNNLSNQKKFVDIFLMNLKNEEKYSYNYEEIKNYILESRCEIILITTNF